MTALADRVSTPVERADFDDLVTLVSQAPPWEKDRAAGVRILLRAIGEGKANAPDQILARWTWQLARATRKVQDRRASAEFPEAKRLLGAVANSRGHRHEDNVAKLVQVARALPLAVGAALLASADGYTPRANALLDQAREDLGPIQEIANALAENLPAPKTPARKSRRRRKKRRGAAAAAAAGGTATARRHGRAARLPRARRSQGAGSGSRGAGDAQPRRDRRLDAFSRQRSRGRRVVVALSRSRRNRVSSAASDSPVGRSASSIISSIVSARRSSSSTYACGLGIRGDGLGDLLGVDSSASSSSPSVDRHVEQLAEPVAERARGARARRERDVVRDRRPEADRRDPRLPAGVVEDADDAGRPLVARGCSPSSSTSEASLAEPVTGAGRVCGTSASSAPSVTTSSTPSSRASADRRAR